MASIDRRIHVFHVRVWDSGRCSAGWTWPRRCDWPRTGGEPCPRHRRPGPSFPRSALRSRERSLGRFQQIEPEGWASSGAFASLRARRACRTRQVTSCSGLRKASDTVSTSATAVCRVASSQSERRGSATKVRSWRIVLRRRRPPVRWSLEAHPPAGSIRRGSLEIVIAANCADPGRAARSTGTHRGGEEGVRPDRRRATMERQAGVRATESAKKARRDFMLIGGNGL